MEQSKHLPIQTWLFIIASVMSVIFTVFFFKQNMLLLYGDAESHLNISKRVTGSITPGLAQLGGIWLPLPHLMMLPFTSIDTLWQTGLAGSIVSGLSYVVSAIVIFKIVTLLSKSKLAGVIASMTFLVNPNIIYLQSTAMTELPLIMFFLLSTYFFFRYLQENNPLILVYAAFWGLCASLTRYDGWFLVLAEGAVLIIHNILARRNFEHTSGKFILFSTLGMCGIALWLIWNAMILKDPFYFTNSPFSAKSQQQGWLARGELPAYHDPVKAVQYYSATAMANMGLVVTIVGAVGLVVFVTSGKKTERLLMTGILFVPFAFYCITLYMGQSVIFIPSLTPSNFTWNLFNTRYGAMMIPVAAILVGFMCGQLIKKMDNKKLATTMAILGSFVILGWQSYRYINLEERIISLEDGLRGLSSAKIPDAQGWLQQNYDEGLVLMDDYSRTLSVIRSGIPMQNMIYIGNQKYWYESLDEPEKYATWIVMQKNDAVWTALLNNPQKEGRLYANFQKTYTSPDILIFKRTVPIRLVSN